MSLTEDRENLERDRDQLQALADLASTVRSQVYDFQTEANGLVLDNVELSEGGVARDIEHAADAMSEYAGEAYNDVAHLLAKAQELLTDLPDEEPCDECGELIPEDETFNLNEHHAEWCSENAKNLED